MSEPRIDPDERIATAVPAGPSNLRERLKELVDLWLADYDLECCNRTLGRCAEQVLDAMENHHD